MTRKLSREECIGQQLTVSIARETIADALYGLGDERVEIRDDELDAIAKETVELYYGDNIGIVCRQNAVNFVVEEVESCTQCRRVVRKALQARHVLLQLFHL